MWKAIENFEGYYEASTDGLVRSLDRYDKRGYFWEGKILKPMKDSNGYLKIRLNKDGKFYTFNLHRLILMTFQPLDNYDNVVVDHIDCDPANNKLENLRWLTPLENLARRNMKTEKRKQAVEKRKKKIYVYRDDELIQTFNSLKECAKHYNVGPATITSWIKGYWVSGKRWSKKQNKFVEYKGKAKPYDESLTFSYDFIQFK